MDPFKFLIDVLRAICFFLDKIVYFFIPLFYKLMLYLARVDLVSGNIPVQALIQRIYILVGVFMLFRLSFSIMNYIVNPDAFSDQAKGFTNLVKRVLIAIILLVSIPFIFAKAYEYQGKILTSGILPRLVLGEANSYENGSGTDQLEKSIETSAKDVQFLVFGPFFSLNYQSPDLAVCDPAQTGKSTSHILGTTGMALSGDCLDTVAGFFDDNKDINSSGTLLSDFFRISSDGKELDEDSRDFSSFGNLVSWSLSDGKYAINYNPIISTICGGYLSFLLLSFCIDVAARVIRLLFLQILSPVAIISSIDPTTSGDRLKEWAKECLKVWLSLFIRLLIIFIIIQLVRVITDTIYNGEYELEGGGIVPWIFIFLVLGVFQAAKNIPEYIEKATGIKMSGELQLNPFKALGGNAGFVGLSGAALGAVGGAASGFVAGVSTATANGHGPLRSTLSGIGAVATGGVTGMFRGGRAGNLKGWGAGLQSGGRISRRMDVREATGGVFGLPGMAIDRVRDVVGASTTYESMENKAKRYDDIGESAGKMKDRAVDQLGKKSNAWKGVQASRELYAQWLKNGVDSSGKKYDQSRYVADLNRAYGEEQKLISDYIDSDGENLGEFVDSNGAKVNQTQSKDAQLSLLRDSAKKSIKDSGITNKDVIEAFKKLDSKEQLALNNKLIKSGKKLITDSEFNLADAWSVLGADGALVKTISEQKALEIRASKEYNDARDRDQAIHSSRTDAHQKFH